MTQYVDVLKKAISSLPENTPEGRAQLYAAARSALNRQLATNEAVPQEEKTRQLAAFESAIATVEASFAPAPSVEPSAPEAQTPATELDEPVTVESDAEEPEVQEPEAPEPEVLEAVVAEEPAIEEENVVEEEEVAPPAQEAAPAPADEADTDTAPDDASRDDADTDDAEPSGVETGSGTGEDDFSVFDRPLFPGRDRNAPAADTRPPADEDIFSDAASGGRAGEDDGDSLFFSGDAPFGSGNDGGEESADEDEEEENLAAVVPPGGGKIADFGLRPDDHSRLSPHGDKEADVFAGSSLAKNGLGKVWLFLAVFILIAAGSAGVYFGRDALSELSLFGASDPRETAEGIAAGRETGEGDELKDKVVTSTPIRVSEMQRPDASLPGGDQEAEEPASEQAPADGIADVLSREASDPAAPPAQDSAPETMPATPEVDEAQPEPQSVAEAERLAEQQAQQAEQNQIVDQTRPTGENEGPAARGAALYEESPDDANKELAWSGTISWELGAEVLADGQTVPTIIGEIAVPGRGLTARMIVRRNFEPGFDASHTIDLEFENASGENLPMVQDVGAVLLKEEEPVRGEPLVAGKAKVTDGYFLFALSDQTEAREKNTTLLQEREWFDVPILFNDNRKAIVVFTKGEEGQSVFANAFATWNNIENPTEPAQGQNQ